MRITEQDCNELIAYINRHYGRVVVEMGFRYDYYALDRIVDGNPYSGPLVAGTKREIYTYLRGMAHAIDLNNGGF